MSISRYIDLLLADGHPWQAVAARTLLFLRYSDSPRGVFVSYVLGARAHARRTLLLEADMLLATARASWVAAR